MLTKVTIKSSLIEKTLLSIQMKVNVDFHENHPSILHPRTLFWGVNISKQGVAPCNTSVPPSVNLSMGISAMIRAQSLNLLVGFEWG